MLDDDDDDVLFEIESLLSGDIEIPIPSDRFNVNGWSRYNTYMANKASEIEGLRSLVKEMEEREAKLEGELLEYYGMKEMEIGEGSLPCRAVWLKGKGVLEGEPTALDRRRR